MKKTTVSPSPVGVVEETVLPVRVQEALGELVGAAKEWAIPGSAETVLIGSLFQLSQFKRAVQDPIVIVSRAPLRTRLAGRLRARCGGARC